MITFFGSAAAAGTDDAKRRGASDQQALAFGLMSGVAEAIPEMIGVEKLLNIGASGTMRELVMNLVKQGASEGVEEGITSVLNSFADQLAMGDKSNFDIIVRDYINKGWNAEDAKKQAWIDMAEDVAFDVLGGFVSGTAHAAPQTVLQTYSENARISNIYGGHVPELIQQGMESAEGSLSKELAKKYQSKIENGGTLSGSEINRMIRANEQQILLEDKASIKQSAENRLTELGEVENVSELAEILAKQATKQKLSPTEKQVIRVSLYGERVANELNPENIRSGDTASEWVRKIGTQRINADEYNPSRMEQALPGQEKEVTGSIPVAESNAPTQSRYEAPGDVDDGTGLIRQTVADMGLNESAANVLVDAFGTDNSVDAETYATGIREAYRYGQFNYPVQEVAKGPFSSLLTEHQRNTAYKLGQMFGSEQAEKAQATVLNNRTGKNSLQVGKVHFDGDRKILTERQRTSLSTLETVANVLGVQIHVFESQVDENGKHIGANGWYDPKDSSIHIDLHAGANGEGTMLFTAAHEMTHYIKQWSPEKFKTMSDFLMTEYGEKGVSIEELVQNQIAKAERNGRTISYDKAFEEVIADSMETMLSDGKVVEKLAKLKQQDKGLWQKMKDFISQLAVKIREAYEGVTPDSQEGRLVAEMKDSVEKLQELFTEGLVEASENQQTSEGQKNTAEDGSAKFSLRNAKVPTRAELEKKEPIKVIDISKPKTKGSFVERRRQILKNAEKIILRPYLNKDTNTQIFLTEKSYTHAFNNLGNIQLNAAECLPELIENAVLAHAEEPTHGSEYTEGVYTFFAAAKADCVMPVKLKVKEYIYAGQDLPKNIKAYFENNPQGYAASYDTVVLEVEEIEKSPSGSAKDMNQNDPFLSPDELSTIKIADLLNLVKGDAEKYLPKLSDRDTESVSNISWRKC